MKELEEGDEACPICNAINNLAAAEIRCNHFVALCWENELHWVDTSLEGLIKLIELIQDLIADKDYSEMANDEIYLLWDPNLNSICDILRSILYVRLIMTNIENDTYLSSGGGTLWYLEKSDIIDEKTTLLNSLRTKLLYGS